MITVAVCGCCGKMGQEVIKTILAQKDLKLVAAIDTQNVGQDIGFITTGKNCDIIVTDDLKATLTQNKPMVVVDFTEPTGLLDKIKVYQETKTASVIGTTGLSDSDIKWIEQSVQQTKTGCLIAPNFSIGAILSMRFAAMAGKYFHNAEIIEFHHNQKKDAPSGTALKTADLMQDAYSSFTEGNCAETETVAGARGGVTSANIHIHSVRIPGIMASQEILFGATGQTLTIRHDTFNRSCYMSGVLLGIKKMAESAEFIYGLEKLI